MFRADAPPIHLKNRRTFTLFTTSISLLNKEFSATNTTGICQATRGEVSSCLSLPRVQPAKALHRGTSGLAMLMRGGIGNGTVCGCPAPRNHMQLARPLVRVLILFVARSCFSGPLLDLSRENETGQPARVKHRRGTRLRYRSRFARKMPLHLASGSRPVHTWSSTPALGTQTLLLLAPAPGSQLRQLFGTHLGLRTWCWSAAHSNGPLHLRSGQPLAHDTFTHLRAAAHSFCFHPGCASSQAELPTTLFPLVWCMFFLHPSSFTD
jgi:hypothetical protein